MKRTGIYLIIILVTVVLLGNTLLGCKKVNPPTNTTSLTTGSTQITTAVPTQPGITANLPGGMPAIADMKSLPSYRFSIMTKMVEGFGAPAGSLDYMKYEYVKAQEAEHAWREDATGKVTETYIKIGDKYWIWFGMAGMGWVEQPPQTTSATPTLPADFANQLKQVQQDAENAKVRFDKKGTETVNNVRCIRYEFEYSMTTEMPNLMAGGTSKVDTHSSGEMWIADQSGLPAVVIKSKSTTEINMTGEKSVMDSEQNLTDIGANITINPPEGATQIPTSIPNIPTGIPTMPPATQTTTPPPTTTSPSTTTPPGTPVFNDDFQGDWDPGFAWTDPNDDATYNLTAHPGFLRLSAPDGNDLAGAMNYDAPRLLIPRDGNFSLETLVEFDPQETYQGAGLLVWQNQDRFLRFEFSYGGMGGIAKNAVFVWGENGGLDLAGSVDLPDTLTRIELRLQREGNQFTASYREVGGTWQEIGSTELVLDSTVEVGIAQVTQYTTSEIPADFDYFKVFSP